MLIHFTDLHRYLPWRSRLFHSDRGRISFRGPICCATRSLGRFRHTPYICYTPQDVRSPCGARVGRLVSRNQPGTGYSWRCSVWRRARSFGVFLGWGRRKSVGRKCCRTRFWAGRLFPENIKKGNKAIFDTQRDLFTAILITQDLRKYLPTIWHR